MKKGKTTMVTIELGKRYQARPSAAEMRRRWQLAAQTMKERDIDCLVMQANEGMLCQYVRWFAERRTAHYCVVLFDRDQNLSIIGHGPLGNQVPAYGMEFANSVCVPQVANAWYGNNVVSDQAAALVKKGGYKKVGLVGLNLIPAAFYLNFTSSLPGVEMTDATEMVDQMVVVKSEEELRLLGDAVLMHEAVGNAIPSLVYAGRLEREFGADLIRLAVLAGADEYLSNIMLCSQRMPGPMHSIHYQNKLIEAGDTLNVLFEVPSITGYYADFHHYWSVGAPCPEAAEAMDLAAEAHEYLARLCVPGAKASDVFHRMNEWKIQRGMEPERRMHGHGQGYGLVERPYFDAMDPMILEENMFLAFHPPIQVRGAQVNPSSNYIVTRNGAKRVNSFTKKLAAI